MSRYINILEVLTYLDYSCSLHAIGPYKDAGWSEPASCPKDQSKRSPFHAVYLLIGSIRPEALDATTHVGIFYDK